MSSTNLIPKFLILFILLVFGAGVAAYCQDTGEKIKELEEKIKYQQQIIEQLQRELEQLKQTIESEQVQKPAEKIVSTSGGLFGSSNLFNPNISLILDTFGYSSNLKDKDLEERNIPGFIKEGIHHRKGMNIHAAELYMFAPMDPFFNLYATIPVTEEGVELEEAYMVTTSLPAGIQAKIGKFKSGFGRLNIQHAHTWNFTDQPLVYRAFMGHEGINEKGIQLTFLPKLPFYTQVGIEALAGENEIFFGKDAGGLKAFSAFAKTSFDVGDYGTILFGPSFIIGDTETDSIEEDHIFRGDTKLAGLEFTYKWKPSRWKSFIFQTEYLWRKQKGNIEDTNTSDVSRLERTQDGLYLQGVFQTGRWGFGARYDLLEPFNDRYKLAGSDVSFGDKPWRASAMVEFNPSEFSKIRFQYNYDKSSRNGKVNNEFYLQFIGGIGAHAAHTF